MLQAFAQELFRLRETLPRFIEAPLLCARYPALAQHYASVDTIAAAFESLGGRVVREWNPLAQRPYLSLFESAPFAELPTTAAEVAYNHWPSLCRDLSELGHELLHVLAWEPFFLGRCNPLTWPEEDFVGFAHATEAACFFYGDNLYRDVGLGVFGDERLRHRSVGFADLGHEAEMFGRAGYERDDEQLERLTDIFTLERESLSWGAGDPAFDALRQRILRFVAMSFEVQRAFLAHMRASSMADEWFDRFCCIEGLPKAHALAPAGSEETQVRAYLRELVDALAAPPVSPPAQLRLRRAAQSRAYYLSQLAHAAREGHLCGADGCVAPEVFEPGLAGYARCLHALAHERDEAQLEFARTNEQVQAQLEQLARAGVYVSQRQLMLPDSDFDGLGLTMVGVNVEVTSPDARYRWLRRCKIDWLALALAEPGLAAQLRTANDDDCSPERRTEAIDALAADPRVRRYWAVHTADFDFKGGRFREPCFELI